MKPKCSKELYCQFLIAAQTNFTATQFADVCPSDIAHDAVTRFLSRTKLTPRILWEYTEPMVDKEEGYLVVDDTVLDHWYSRKIDLAKWQYSGTHHRVVQGVGLTTLVWTNRLPKEDAEHIPVDYRIYAPIQDGMTKNQHFREMLRLARHRGLQPKAVVMDSWYAAVDTLRLINHDYDWIFLAWLKSNRIVYLGRGKENRHQVKEVSIPNQGRLVHLKGFGQVKVFRVVTKEGKVDYLATNDLSLTFPDIQEVAARRWKVEEYHRGLKQTTGVESCQSRTGRSQRTHIFCAILSFLALEKKRLEDGITWYESKRKIIADALFLYLKQPMVPLPVSDC